MLELGDDDSAGRRQHVEPITHTNEIWKEIFNKHDRDKDGKIRVDDFIAGLKSEGQAVPPVLRDFKDGTDHPTITHNEFMEMMRNERGSKYKKFVRSYIRCTVGPRTRYDATDGEYEDEYSCNPPKMCMAVVSLLELATFAYDWTRYGDQLAECRYPEGSLAKFLIYDPSRRTESWRYLSYMFVHIGPHHLIVNLIVQILLGVPLELVHGNLRVLCIYVAGVFAGSLGTSISDPTVFLAGASGGVYALMTAHVASIIMNWSEMQYAPHQLIIFGGLTLIDVGTAIQKRYFRDDLSNRIGYVAHFAGAITGLLVGINVLRNLRVKSWEEKAWWASLVLYSFLMLAAIVINIADSSHFPPQKVPI